jgi:hypothetical protein
MKSTTAGGTTANLVEEFKLAVDVVKHIATLATGAIVLLATFLDKFTKPIHAPAAIATAVVALVVCVVFSGVFLLGAGLGPFWWGHADRVSKRLLGINGFGIYVSFCTGVTALAYFVLKNLA